MPKLPSCGWLHKFALELRVQHNSMGSFGNSLLAFMIACHQALGFTQKKKIIIINKTLPAIQLTTSQTADCKIFRPTTWLTSVVVSTALTPFGLLKWTCTTNCRRQLRHLSQSPATFVTHLGLVLCDAAQWARLPQECAYRDEMHKRA